VEVREAAEMLKVVKKAVVFMALGKEPMYGEPVRDYVERVEREIREARAGAREGQRVPAG